MVVSLKRLAGYTTTAAIPTSYLSTSSEESAGLELVRRDCLFPVNNLAQASWLYPTNYFF